MNKFLLFLSFIALIGVVSAESFYVSVGYSDSYVPYNPQVVYNYVPTYTYVNNYVPYNTYVGYGYYVPGTTHYVNNTEAYVYTYPYVPSYGNNYGVEYVSYATYYT